ncbi:MFS transporter [Microbispora sp. RL4-1S]|uniref:MFS transporter n=1 Tax=Microbispora oryzae TaxID=2806554 RepID=A0A940WW43_9ACTN|nr:MFS transporter [Microbispora oryzae]MBP2708366.1 MFS transporter [Microbispora oryzae]
MTYFGLLRRPSVIRALGGSLVGRLPTAMAALAMTLTLRAQGMDFRFAGLATGVLAVSGAIGGPLLGRMVDRWGQTYILIVSALLSCLGLVLIALVPWSEPLVLAGAVICGAATPPLEPCLRTLWPRLVGQENVQRAYALDAAAQELVFIGGPLIVAAAVAVAPPEAALILAAVLCAAGVLTMATSRASREWRGEPGARDWLGPLRSRALVLLFLGLAGAGTAVGGLNIIAVGYAERHAVPGGAGTLLALSALGALAGAIAHGRRPWPWTPTAQAVLFGAGLTVTYLLVASTAPVWIMMPICLSTGLFLSPLLVVAFTMVDAFAPAGTVTEAFAWIITLFTTGTATGSAIAGVVMETVGIGAAAASTALVALLGTVILALCHRLPESRRLATPATGTPDERRTPAENG